MSDLFFSGLLGASSKHRKGADVSSLLSSGSGGAEKADDIVSMVRGILDEGEERSQKIRSFHDMVKVGHRASMKADMKKKAEARRREAARLAQEVRSAVASGDVRRAKALAHQLATLAGKVKQLASSLPSSSASASMETGRAAAVSAGPGVVVPVDGRGDDQVVLSLEAQAVVLNEDDGVNAVIPDDLPNAQGQAGAGLPEDPVRLSAEVAQGLRSREGRLLGAPEYGKEEPADILRDVARIVRRCQRDLAMMKKRPHPAQRSVPTGPDDLGAARGKLTVARAFPSARS